MELRPSFPRIIGTAPLAKGLVFAALGGGAGTVTAFDASQHGKHSTLTGMDPATDWVDVPELGRKALDFAGDNDELVIPGTPLNALTAFTFSAWSYRRTSDNFENALAFKANEFAVTMDQTPPYPTELWLRDGAGWSKTGTLQATGPLSVWQHVAVTFDGVSGRGYIDGVLTMGPSADAKQNTTADLRLMFDVTTSTYMDGQMADPCLWNRALSPNEIAALADPSNTLLEVGNQPLIWTPRQMSYFYATLSTLTLVDNMAHWVY